MICGRKQSGGLFLPTWATSGSEAIGALSRKIPSIEITQKGGVVLIILLCRTRDSNKEERWDCGYYSALQNKGFEQGNLIYHGKSVKFYGRYIKDNKRIISYYIYEVFNCESK